MTLRRALIALACALVATIAAAPASASLKMYMGAAEDEGRNADPQVAMTKMELAKAAGFDTIRITAIWAPGQSAVPNLATSRPTHKPIFSNAKRGEVVVKHEALRGLRRIEHLDPLFVVLRAKGGGDQGLRFAAREDRRTVGPRQYTDFAPDVTKFVELAPVRTAAFL